MPVCSRCSDRSFKDDNALRMHRESKHPYTCEECDRAFQSQQALDQHTTDRHSSFECHYCNREFSTENALLSHERAKHPPMFGCEYCDQEFTTDQGRLAHQKAKHPPMFECQYCNKEFTTSQGRDAHEEAKHATFECHNCDHKFNSEGALQQHEVAKHNTCSHCYQGFSSENALRMHKDAKHNIFSCKLCGVGFIGAEALRKHERASHSNWKCSYCTEEFFTADSKTTHEVSCNCNPVNHVERLTSTFSGQPWSRNPGPTVTVQEVSSIFDVTQHTDGTLILPPSPFHSPDSSFSGGDMFHSTSGTIPAGTAGEGVTLEQPCACVQSSNTSGLILGDEMDIDSTVDSHRNYPTVRDVTFQCTLCLALFETAETRRNHVCAIRAAMLRPHCPICYSQFDDGSLLQQHLDGLQSFSCQLCLTRCCSDEMLQDHLLSHPTCSKCGQSFADHLALCRHVESDHPVIVCWDCGGIVVETNSLELHYTDSLAHPSCALCGLGKRDSAEMDEHVRHTHASSAEMEMHPERDDVCLSQESPLAEMRPPQAYQEDAAQYALEELDRVPSSIIEIVSPLSKSGDGLHKSPPQTGSSLFLSPQPVMPPDSEGVNGAAGNTLVTSGEGLPDIGLCQYGTPSPTPSEHGSNISRLQLHASGITSEAMNNDTHPPSPVSSAEAEALSEINTQSSPTSSSQSVVFVSADGIPDYIRENRAVLVATSAGSPSSGRTPLRLPSWSSLESLEMTRRTSDQRVSISNAASPPAPHPAAAAHHFHCRICLQDPCEDMTATLCGHVFCNRCITQAIVAKSECPVCKNATLLYCLFKLDLST